MKSLFPLLHKKVVLPAVLSASVMLSACLGGDDQPAEPQIPVEPAAIEQVELPTDVYGLPDLNYDVTERNVRRGETLSTILSAHGVNHRTIHDITVASADVFNVRRINAGRTIRFYKDEESGHLDYFVYIPERSSFVVFNLTGETPEVYRDERAQSVEVQRIEGTIEGSLYLSLMEQGGSPALVSALAQVFAWQVDFYRIQRGDSYKVVYEEYFIDDEPAGIGRIKAAYFNHRGREYHGIYFVQGDGRGTYFDLEGNSLQKAFLRAPLDYTRISSRFTNRRYHPVLRRNMPHHGTDYAAPVGTPIRAVGDGQIVHSGYDRNNGNYIRIRHNSVYDTGYLHMSRIAGGMRRGAQVRQGDVIGFVGATGLATGPHLCFRFWQNGQPVDPYRVEMPPSEPIDEAYLAEYEDVKTRKMYLLYPDTVPPSPAYHLAKAGNTSEFDEEPSVLVQF